MRPSSLDQAGLLLAIGIEGTEPTAGLERLLTRAAPAAVVLTRRNVGGAAEFTRLIQRIRAQRLPDGSRPLVLAVHEGGAVHGFGTLLTQAPAALALGATAEPALARRLGRAVGAELRRWGIDSPLAPVLDRAEAFDQPGALSRTLGRDPELVASLACAWIHGLVEGGAAACGKHFPGLSGARRDPNDGPENIRRSPRERLADLEPFRQAIGRGESDLGLVLVSHAVYPDIDPDAPASFSRPIIQGLLREELGFLGLVLSDDLTMAAVAAAAPPAEGAVKALAAGCDLALVAQPGGALEVRERIAAAIERGEISPEDVAASLARRQDLIERLGRGPNAAEAEPVSAAGAAVAQAALTRIAGLSSLSPHYGGKTAILDLAHPLRTCLPDGEVDPGSYLASCLPGARLLSAEEPSAAGERLVVLLGSRSVDPEASPALSGPARDRVLIALAVPPHPGSIPPAEVYMAAYSPDPATMNHLAHVLCHGGRLSGRLPLDPEPPARRPLAR